jgi:hypothetical protein
MFGDCNNSNSKVLISLPALTLHGNGSFWLHSLTTKKVLAELELAELPIDLKLLRS